MKLGISGQPFEGRMELRDIIETIKCYGVSGLELWPQNLMEDLRSTKRLLVETGITGTCLAMPAAFDKSSASDSHLYRSRLIDTMEKAHELGIPLVSHYCYYLAPLSPEPNAMDSDVKGYQDILAGLQSVWEPSIKRAQELGITLVLENEAHDFVRTPGSMKRVIESVSSAHFKTNFDPCNYYQAGCEGYPDAYRCLQDHIGYVHIKNATVKVDSDSGFRYCSLQDGGLNVSGLLVALATDGYRGWCTLEPHVPYEEVLSFYRCETDFLYTKEYFERV